MKYGFLAAGFGRNYTDELCKLERGSKLFAYMKGLGYVGYGEVVHEARAVKDFVPIGHKKPLLKLPLTAEHMGHDRNNLDECEWVVGVKWHKTFPREQAKTFTGIFASPHIVCKPGDQRTLKYLHREFNVSD